MDDNANYDEDDINKEKYAKFKEDFNQRNKFTNTINDLYKTEFEEVFQEVLRFKESEIIASLTHAVENMLTNWYTDAIFQNKSLKDIIQKEEKAIKKEFQTHFKIINNSWSAYESKLKQRNDVGSLYLTKYRKHCPNSDEYAYHSCEKNKAKFIEVKINDKVVYLICSECKKCYFADFISCYCTYCQTQFYSSLINEEENPEFLPATWENYHCERVINDKMKCVECKNDFYLNLHTNMLICINPECLSKKNPKKIQWTCTICKRFFSSNAIVYNPLDIKVANIIIKQALLVNIKAHPAKVPCCIINVLHTDFHHNTECDGILYEGEFNTKMILICGKCKEINFLDKFIWTCPECGTKFKDKNKSNEFQLIFEEKRNMLSSIENLYNDKRSIDKNPKIKENKNAKEKKTSNLKKNNITDIDSNLKEISDSPNKINQYRQRDLVNKKINKNESNNYETTLLKYTSSNVHIEVLNINKNIGKRSSFIDNNNNKKESKLSITDPNSDISDYHRKKNDIDKRVSFRDTPKVNVKIKVDDKEKHNPKKPLIIYSDSKKKSEEIKKQQELKVSSGKIRNAKSQKKQEPKIYSPFIKNEEHLNNLIDQAFDLYSQEKPKEINVVDQKLNEIISKGELPKFDVDNYRIVKQLGEGTYGIIYRVQEKKTRKYFALKRLIAHDLEEVEAFQKEFELVHLCDHPNVMKIFGVDIKSLDETTYSINVLMEMATIDWDDDIRNHIDNKKKYKEEDLINIMKQLVDALQFMQTKKISHRDIKPKNILVFPSNVYKVADFGEAKKMWLSKQWNTLRGTELYMSPILYNGLKQNKEDVSHNSFKSDVFSLAYCFIYAATLNFGVISEIREIKEMDKVEDIIKTKLSKSYSQKFIYLLITMLQLEEKKRVDFIQLNNYITKEFKDKDN